MRLKLLGLIIEALAEVQKSSDGTEGLTLEELQRIVTRKRIREGWTKSVGKLIGRSPLTIFRLFRKIPQKRIVQALLVHQSHGRISMDEKSIRYAEAADGDYAELARIFNIHKTEFMLDNGFRGKETVEFWANMRNGFAVKKTGPPP